MDKRNRILGWILCVVIVPGTMIAGLGSTRVHAQTTPAAKAQAATATPISDDELSSTQDQLIQLLRTSPKLTTVVARDPSLLSDQEYVNRNNPQLAQFLIQHPDIARNPEYYLFTRLEGRGGRRDQALERAVWPEYSEPRQNNWLDIVGPIAAATASVIASPAAGSFHPQRAFVPRHCSARIASPTAAAT